jgi:hypothetical protein
MSKTKRLYHTTTASNAAAIMFGGFRDTMTINKRWSGTRVYEPGVWFGDVPAIDDELFDGIGLFNFDTEKQTFIVIDARLPCTGIRSVTGDDTWPGVQF